MAAKLKLVANPTFTGMVSIPVAGADPVEVQFTFKHKTRDDYKAFLESTDKKGDAKMILEIATGWELEDPFNEKSLETLIQNYHGSDFAIISGYMMALTSTRAKN